MYRIKIYHKISGDGLNARLKSASFTRTVYVASDEWYIIDNKDLKNEFIYQLKRKCIEMMRDELFLRHGNLWRKFQIRKDMIASSNGAIKRMRGYLNNA